MAVPEGDLHGCTHAVGLHLPEESALLALHAIQYPGDVVDVFLVRVDIVRIQGGEFVKLKRSFLKLS